MKYNNDSLNQVQDSDGLETETLKKVTEPTVSVIPSLNRFIEDLRTDIVRVAVSMYKSIGPMEEWQFHIVYRLDRKYGQGNPDHIFIL